MAAMSLFKVNLEKEWFLGYIVVSWLALSPHIKRAPGSNPSGGLSVWSFLTVCMWILSRYFCFLPLPKNIHVRLIGDSKLSPGVSVSLCGCVSRLSLCGLVMDWQPVQGVSCLSPWHLGSSPPATLNAIKRVKKMHGWIISQWVWPKPLNHQTIKPSCIGM